MANSQLPCKILLLLAVCTYCMASDKSWKFDVSSKAEAVDQANAGVGFSDDGAEDPVKLRDMFHDLVEEFGQTFPSVQAQQKAFQNFKDNMKKVWRVNKDASIPYWLTGNAYSIMSYEEFRASVLANLEVPEESKHHLKSRKLMGKPARSPQPSPSPSPSPAAGTVVNWVTANKVTPIRDQGQCGSCWAFAATSAVESMYLINMGGDVSTLNLSEQQLVDCDTGSGGCNGGSSGSAMNYISSMGQTTEARYPYSTATGTCDATIVSGDAPGNVVQSGSSYTSVTALDQAALIQAVTKAPTVIYFMVDDTWQSYGGGIYVPSTCTIDVNHAMVAVGYDTNQGYWLVRNSWGTFWGEAGYAKVKMTGNGYGPCGMYRYAIQPSATFASPALVA